MPMLKGLKRLFYAILTKDDETGVAYGTPKRLSGVNKANVTRKVNEATFDADDKIWETAYAYDATELELTVADLMPEDYAALLGHTVVGAELRKNTADAGNVPTVAIGFEATKSNGKSKLIWLYGGKFQPPNDENEAASKSITLRPATIKASFIGHNYDGATERIMDMDSPNYVAGMADAFFDSPLPIDDSTALAVTVVPANNATAVAVGSAITWTFNKAIQATDMIATNFMVFKDNGALVAGALVIDDAHKVVTFTPSTSLSAASGYYALVSTNVKDIYGKTLAVQSITKFTTA